jgi:hypothetical protein
VERPARNAVLRGVEWHLLRRGASCGGSGPRAWRISRGTGSEMPRGSRVTRRFAVPEPPSSARARQPTETTDGSIWRAGRAIRAAPAAVAQAARGETAQVDAMTSAMRSGNSSSNGRPRISDSAATPIAARRNDDRIVPAALAAGSAAHSRAVARIPQLFEPRPKDVFDDQQAPAASPSAVRARSRRAPLALSCSMATAGKLTHQAQGSVDVDRHLPCVGTRELIGAGPAPGGDRPREGVRRRRSAPRF